MAQEDQASSETVDEDDPLHGVDPDCANGSCPMTSPPATAESCGIWLGPSPIKQAENHFFGLGMFTGKAIPAGTAIETALYNGAEPLIPIYGSDSIYDEHPPLREYVWGEDNIPEVAIEYPIDLTALFFPGLASIAPCTSHNFNVRMHGTGRYGDTRASVAADIRLHRAQHPTAGAVAVRNNVTYVAVRDIAPGEELVVECTDDSFDGGAYFLSRYNEQEDAVMCLDQWFTVEEVPEVGKGLVAKRVIPADAVIVSSPMVPMHRRELDIHDATVNSKQLLLNYVYGHPDSDLLWLPFGPAISFLNHNDAPNAQIRWHVSKKKTTARRQQHHDADLLKWPADSVSQAHGRSLTLDVVALREIQPHEEIVIDYGSAWREAWANHLTTWLRRQPTDAAARQYQSAESFHQSQGGIVRTVEEQKSLPYPNNMETFCYCMEHNADNIGEEQVPTDDVRYFDFEHEVDHSCFRPCAVLERHQNPGDTHPTYTVQLSQSDNIRIIEHCVIYAEYVVSHVPHSAIIVVDRPYTTDVFLPSAFRHEIGMPEGMYPANWMRKKLRKTVDMASPDDAEFKRKTSSTTVE